MSQWKILAGIFFLLVVSGCVSEPTLPPVTPGDGSNGDETPNGNGGLENPPIDYPPVPSDTQYTYGAKFEPPEGRIFHAEGQWEGYNQSYEQLLPPALEPASELIFISLGDTARDWNPSQIKTHIFATGNKQHIPSLDLSLRGNKIPLSVISTLPDPYYGIDNEIAHTTKYDSRIKDIIQIIKEYKRPVFIRIGGEFNGNWNGYHPYDYPLAFRKIVQMFKDAKVDNAAFVWSYEPAAPNDYFEQNVQGENKWFPGDDVIDWYSIDVFATHDISGLEMKGGEITNYGKTLEFLEAAEEHQKPVVLSESSPSGVDITPSDADGKSDWVAWFVPYFDLINSHPVIKGFHYINYDWTKANDYQDDGWKDADITQNEYISGQFIEELQKSHYLHADEVYLLKDFVKYK